MAVKVKHNTTGNGTHEQRVAIYRAQLQAQRKQAAFLQGKKDFFQQVPMITDGSKYEVTHVDATEPLQELTEGSNFTLKSGGTGIVGTPLLTEEEALEEVELMSNNFNSQLTEEEALNEVELMSNNFNQDPPKE